MTVAFCVLALWGRWAVTDIHCRLTSLVENQLPASQAISKINTTLRAWNYAALNSVLEGHAKQAESFLQEVAVREDAAYQQITALREVPWLPSEGHRLLDDVHLTLEEAARLHHEFMHLESEGRREEAVVLYREQLRSRTDRLEAAMADLRTLRETLLADAVQAARYRLDQVAHTAYWIIGLTFLGTVLVAFTSAQRISRGVSAAVQAADEVAREVLHCRLSSAGGTDEAAYLKNHVSAMRAALEASFAERGLMEQHLRRLDAELAHAARLSTMGEMASGMAHELNQPLAAIAAYTQACLERAAGDQLQTENLRGTLQKTAAQAQRAGTIVRRMRDFVRREPARPALLDLNDTVREALSLADFEVRRNGVRVEFVEGRPAPLVWADRIELEQVIINLIRNGIEAMAASDEGHRRLWIRTAVVGDSEVRVTVVDSGVGLPAEHRRNLFKPFFTTKPNGLGMGLAVSRSLVEARGGRLWAEPNPEGGAGFTFSLPHGKVGYGHHG